MTENAFYSHSKCHFKKFYSGGKYRCLLNFMKNNSKTFRPNNHLWLLQTFFANSKFEMCVNSKKKFLYIAKMFIAKRFYFWGEINRRYLPFKNRQKLLFTHFENNKKLRCDRRPLNFSTLHWQSDNKIVAYCCLEVGTIFTCSEWWPKGRAFLYPTCTPSMSCKQRDFIWSKP